jgi:hypothetical protein
MVKRTLFVLGIMCIAIMMAAPSFALFGIGKENLAPKGAPYSPLGWDWRAYDRPIFAPAPCPPYPVGKKIVKTWEAKIVGPAPGCGFGGGGFGGNYGWGGAGGALLDVFPTAGIATRFAGNIVTPLDFLFGGFSLSQQCSKYGGGACGADGCMRGPIPAALLVPVHLLGAPVTVFGGIF